jgi:hypothetical protein
MSQYKYRNYRPGPHYLGELMDEIYDKTNKQNAAFEKMMAERLREERRCRDAVYAPCVDGGGGKNARSGGGGSFWLAAGLLLGGYVVLQLL